MRHALSGILLAAALLLAPPAALAQVEPVVRGPYLQSPTPQSIVVRWLSGAPSDSVVRYGTEAGNLDRVASDPGVTHDHAVLVAGLEPDTRYHYSVGSSLGEHSTLPDQTFVTPPVAGARRPLRIWAFGDSGWGDARAESDEVTDAYLAFTGERGTDLWLLLGDNAYAAGSDAEYQANFFEQYPQVMRGTPFYSTFGNHENFYAFSTAAQCEARAMSGPECGNYYDMFTFPTAGEAGGVPSGREAWFSFDHGNVHFINLDSQDVSRQPGSPMLAWLEADLAANTREWTIVFFHHPVYSFGSHNSDTDLANGEIAGVPIGTPPTAADDFAIQEMRGHVLPILEAHGVDLVLTAHSHQYERSKLIDGHYGTSDTFDPGTMEIDGGDGVIDGDGAYRKPVGTLDDAHGGTVYAVVGTGAESSFAAELHPAMAVTVHAAGGLVIDVDGPRLDGRFVDHEGATRDHFTIFRGAANAAPVARDDQATTAPLTAVAIDVLANDLDPDDDLLAVESVSAPERGTTTIDGDGTVTYAPAADFAAGQDGFTYTVGDGHGNLASAKVTVTVGCPAARDGVFRDDLEPGAAPGWQVQTFRNTIAASLPWTVVPDPEGGGNVWFSDSSPVARLKDDRLIAPALDLSPASRLTFRHRYDFELDWDGGVLEISEDGGVNWTDLEPAIVAGGYPDVTVSVGGVERRAWTGSSGGGMGLVEVELGEFAGPGRLIRWRLVADDYTFETTEGWYVDDVEVTGLPGTPGDCNLPPIARDDEAATDQGAAVEIDVLANDFDPDGDPLAVGAVGDPAHGSASVSPGGVTYQPEPGFSGVDSFTYQASDGELGAEATVTVTVRGMPIALSRARGNGWIVDGAAPGHFAFHARLEAGGARGWLRYDGGDAPHELEIDGQATEIVFTSETRAELSGACWLGDGAPCTFLATVEDNGHPGAGLDRFGIEVFDADEVPVHAVEGVAVRGQVKLD